MDWSSRRTGTALIGEPRGRVDEKSWEVFLANMLGAIGEAGQAKLSFILDLEQLDYMSSRGLRVLTLAKRESDVQNVSFVLARPNDRMREILAISRYDKIFRVDESVA